MFRLGVAVAGGPRRFSVENQFWAIRSRYMPYPPRMDRDPLLNTSQANPIRGLIIHGSLSVAVCLHSANPFVIRSIAFPPWPANR